MGKTTVSGKLAYSTEEACATLSIGRTALFDLLRRNEISSVKIGRRRVIPTTSLEAYMDRLIAEQTDQTA